MAARRKRHVQQALFRHGGRRKGAGRPPKGARAGQSHEGRPVIKARHALHVVLRVAPEVGNLRRREMYRAIRAASITAAVRARIRIVHISIQRTHIHLLVEAEDKRALGRGMQGFEISAARHIKAALGDARRGRVFCDRYHLVVITSPTQARNVLSYVLNNWRKHAEDGSGTLVDPFSTGVLFAGWKELEQTGMWQIPAGYEPLVVERPRSWLLSRGWALAGKVSAREVPSRRVVVQAGVAGVL
jgi:REP element-mobilizing transposase RayT